MHRQNLKKIQGSTRKNKRKKLKNDIKGKNERNKKMKKK